ncbi:putative cytochrome P450 49a1 [Babylonia areolata]|uniref:putative cytochrome P450 49a1 n=1 Tax=Babylonia areolata TaxID=304850 RepID=UPI003FD10BBE
MGSIDDFLPEIYKYVTEAKLEEKNSNIYVFLSAVGTVCFDRRLGLLNDGNPEGDSFIRAVGESLTLVQKELQLLPLYRHVPTPVFARFTSAQNYIREFSARHMQQTAVSNDEDSTTGQLVRRLLFSSNLTYRQVATFISEFFAAGVDTTGHYLAFTLYALASNQGRQQRLYDELKDVTDRDITSGALDAAPYLRAFLRESLRMYPVAPGLGRTLQKDAVLGGFHVPAGTNVVMQYDIAAKDRRFVADPEDFRPERWLRHSRQQTPPFLTLPFGFGPRSCPGRRLASQEVAIAVTKILQRYRVTYNGGDLPIKMQIVNTPDEPLSFRFHDRSA